MTVAVLPERNRNLFNALGAVAETPGQWAVIGGLAVWCRLGGPHRPTLDIDTAAGPDARATLLSIGAPTEAAHRRMVDGVKVEVIEVDDPGEDLDGFGDQECLFLASHWSAAATAQPVVVRCGPEELSVSVAQTGPLVACKLHAWIDRRATRPEKRGSDGLDIVRLLEHTDWDDLAGVIASCPGLGASVRWAAETVLVDQATRVARLIGVHTDTSAPPGGHVENLGRLLVDACC